MARRTEPNYSRAAKAYLREIRRYERAVKELGATSPEGQFAARHATALRKCLVDSIPAEHLPA